MLSGWSSDQLEQQEGHPCQALAYLQKPVESARLLQVLGQATKAGGGDRKPPVNPAAGAFAAGTAVVEVRPDGLPSQAVQHV